MNITIYKNVLLVLFLLGVAVCLSGAVVYFPNYVPYLFALLGFIGLVLFAFRFPFYAFLIFIVALPFEAAFVIEAGFTIRLSYILLVLTFIGLFFSGRKLRFESPLNIPIFIFLVVCTLSLLMTIIYSPPAIEFEGEAIGYRGNQLRSIIQLLFLFFFASAYFLTFHFCSNQKSLEKILKTYIGIALIVSAYGIYQFFAIKFGLPFVDITNAITTSGVGYGASYWTTPELFRSHATFQEPLTFGNYILSIFPLVLVLYLFKSKNQATPLSKGTEHENTLIIKVASLIKSNLFFVLIFVTALFLTKSRGAWVGFAVALLLIFFLIKIKHKLKLISFTILALIIFSTLTAVFLPQYHNLGEFIGYRFRPEVWEIQPIQSRIFPDPPTLALWQKYPFLGVGIGNYGLWGAELYYREKIGVAGGQGLLSQVLIETGILGIAALLFLIFIYCKTIIRAIKKTKNTSWYPYFFGYLASFTAMMVQHLATFDRLPLYFWVFLGISMATVKLINKPR